MPLPKHKTSSSKRNTRRSHDFLTPPQLSNCPSVTSLACRTMSAPLAVFTRAGWWCPSRGVRPDHGLHADRRTAHDQRSCPPDRRGKNQAGSGGAGRRRDFPLDIMRDLAQADLCGMIIPQEYGGLGLGCLENGLAVEELTEGCGAWPLPLRPAAWAPIPSCSSALRSRKRNICRTSPGAKPGGLRP